MTVESAQVRQLLDADDDAVLVLLEGRTEVLAADELSDDAHRGALRIISRADLLERAGTATPSDAELAEIAAALDVETTELGG